MMKGLKDDHLYIQIFLIGNFYFYRFLNETKHPRFDF